MYLVNGTEVEKVNFNLPIENLAVWRGDGVFEAIKLHDGFPFGLNRHIERLKDSCKKQYFNGVNFELVKNSIIEISSKYKSGYVRVLILRNDLDEGFDIFSFYQNPQAIPPVITLESQFAPWHPGGDYEVYPDSLIGSKSTSYAYNVRQTREANQKGYTDALLVNSKQVILEGPTFSIGWIDGNEVFVPDLGLGILNSITRQYLLKFGDEKKLKVNCARITLQEIYKVDSVFILSTAKHAVFVSKIDDNLYSESPVIKDIQELYKQEVLLEKARFQEVINETHWVFSWFWLSL